MLFFMFMFTAHMVLECVAVAKLLPARVTLIGEGVVMDSHVAISVGMTTKKSSTLTTANTSLPPMHVVDVVEQ